MEPTQEKLTTDFADEFAFLEDLDMTFKSRSNHAEETGTLKMDQ